MTNKTAEKCYTGQPIVDAVREYVVCATCKDVNSTIGLRGNAWFDPYVAYGSHMGAYVHFGCLSIQRKAELETQVC